MRHVGETARESEAAAWDDCTYPLVKNGGKAARADSSSRCFAGSIISERSHFPVFAGSTISEQLQFPVKEYF